MITVVNFYDPRSAEAINTTSRSENWSSGLSPFFLGPIELYDGHYARNFENAWQFSKVYPDFVDEHQDPTEAYWDWARQGWADRYARRYPMGKGAIPLYSYWEDEKLGYIEARKKIYAPLYAKAMEPTEAWRKLKLQYETDGDIILADFDAYDHRALGMDYSQVLHNEKKKMGHAFVLAMMLEEQREWEK